MNNSSLAQKSYEEALKYIQITGSPDEVQTLQEVLQMIVSTSAGRQIVQGLAARGETIPLFFVEDLKEKDAEFDFKLNGTFSSRDNSVKLLKEPTTLSEKSIHSRIKMARLLAHELQHSADDEKNKWLSSYAANIDESVLVDVLAEAHAILQEDQLKRELFFQYDLFDKKDTGEKGGPESVDPLPADRCKKAMERALSGSVPLFKKYMNRIRKIKAQKKYEVRNFRETMAFRNNVEYYLKKMLNSDMSFDEAMLWVKQSIKLLPAVKTKLTDRDK